MEIPTWLASVCVASLLGFLMYVYKDIRAMTLDVAKLTARMEDIKERLDRIEDDIDNLANRKR